MESNCKSVDKDCQARSFEKRKVFHDPVPMVDLEATGRRIKELREQVGLTVLELQEILRLSSPQAIYKWQRGDGLPGLENLFALAKIFGVCVEDIIIFIPKN